MRGDPADAISPSHPSADAAPALDGLRRLALSSMHVAEDLLAILRASRAARSPLESPDAALAARGLDRPDAIPHAFAAYFGRRPPPRTSR